jgi:hypothetical protein
MQLKESQLVIFETRIRMIANIVLVNLQRKNTQVYDRCAKTKLLYKTFQKLYIKFHLEEAGKA